MYQKMEIMMDLYNAKTDKAVTEILNRVKKEYGKSVLWKPLGGNTNNISTVNSQMLEPVRCLAEIIVNSQDSMKMLEALKEGVDLTDPNDPKMPKNSKEALKRYFGVPEEGLYKMEEDKNLTPLAQQNNIGVVFERTKANDSAIIMFDKGEGQRPDRFEKTLLSLNTGNKACIPFVQGKYNMGSTGVLKKCNGNHYQLVISMRNMELKDADGKIGFTIVRQTDTPVAGSKLKYYEYLTINNEIPYVESTGVNFNHIGKAALVDEPDFFNGGCIKKFYSYNMIGEDKCCGFFDIRNKINALFSDTGLPVRLKFLDQKTNVRWNNILGVYNKILNTENQKKIRVRGNGIIKAGGGDINVEWFVFDDPVGGENTPDKNYIKGHNVSFIDNGQNNGDFGRSFLSKDCELPHISKNMMVFVDTSNVPTIEMTDFYTASRDRIDLSVPLAQNVVKQLKDMLSNNETLVKYNEEMKGGTVHGGADAEAMKKAIIKKLSAVPDLKKMLNGSNGSMIKKIAGFGAKAEAEDCAYKTSRERGVIKLEKNEKKRETIEFGKSGTIAVNLGSEEKPITPSDVADKIEITISSVISSKVGHGRPSVKDKKKYFKPNNMYSMEIKENELRIIVNPETMGYQASDRFDISIKGKDPKDAIDALVSVFVKEKVEKKRKKRGKTTVPDVDIPDFFFTTKNGEQGVSVSWKDAGIPEKGGENVICHLVTGEKLERIYINLDNDLYIKKVGGAINAKNEKDKWIDKVYIQAFFDFVNHLNALSDLLRDKEDKNEFIQKLAEGTEINIQNSFALNAA